MDIFISDPHLGHSNMLTFERTQFKNIEEHDSFIKKVIKDTVKKHDTLYVLGDVGNLTKENIAFWKGLPCKTILIRGNHDLQKEKAQKAFDVVSDVPIYYNRRIVLSHEPIPVKQDVLNVHGHLHAATLKSKNHFNISMHMVDYKPVTAKQITKKMNALPKISETFMFEWYASLYDFTNERDDIVYKADGSINLLASRQNQLEKPKLKQKIEKAMKQYLDRYPSESKENKEKLDKVIKLYMTYNYASNENFTPKDIHDYMHPKKKKGDG